MPVTFTDQGSNVMRVSAGKALVRASDDDTVKLVQYSLAQQDLTIPANTTRYIGVQYNSGAPNYVVSAADTWDWNTTFRIAIVYNEGGTLHIRSTLHRSGNFQRWANQRLYDVERIKHNAGLQLGESGGANRYVTFTAGSLYSSLEKYTISAFNTSGAHRFDVYYRDSGSGWTKVATQQNWPNAQYDDDSGTLADMTAAYYANLWVYLETDGHLVMLYGQAEYTSQAAAQGESPPTTLPTRLGDTGILMGRYVFLKSATDPLVTQTAFPTSIAGSLVTDHGTLAGLADDDHAQYAKLLGRSASWQELYGTTDDTGGGLALVSNNTATTNDASRITIGEHITHGLGAIIASIRNFGGSFADELLIKTGRVNVINKLGVGLSSAITASTVLEAASTTGAFLPPRMTTAQRNALTASNGMIIYNATTNQFNFREGGSWVTGSGLA